jgi:ribosomal protein L37AE/L43A
MTGKRPGKGHGTMRNGTLLPAVRPLPAAAAELRSQQVREFPAAERAAGSFVPACDACTGPPHGRSADTAWMSQPCRWSCMNATSTPYERHGSAV